MRLSGTSRAGSELTRNYFKSCRDSNNGGTMKKVLLSVFLLQIVSYGLETEIPGESSGCQISMKISMNQVKPEDESGSAVVEVKLVDKSGVPISGKDLVLTASWGTFLCRLPQDSSSIEPADSRSCFVTDQDGKTRINLINLPINSPVNVKATCDCGDYIVSATGKLAIKRQVKRK